MKIFYCSVFFLLLMAGNYSNSLSQVIFNYDASLPVYEEEILLHNPWTGGLNSPQFGNIDLNNDGLQDLVVYDRSSAQLLPYLSQGNQWQFAPGYRTLFPNDLEGFVLLQDYNCDGKPDIFTHTLFGIKVYKNTTREQLSWELVADPIFWGPNLNSNIQVNIIDIPGLADLDNDGDLDILVYDFAVGGYIRHYKNLSMEKYGHCEALEYDLENREWGDFEECTCDIFAFNTTCDELEGGRVQHAGGKSILLIDLDNDTDQDLLMSQEDCRTLYKLENQGVPGNALMNSFSMDFPADNPAQLDLFPAAYYADADHDGIPDLLVAPNVYQNVNGLIDFQNSSWFYKNTGTAELPEFVFAETDFLQQQTIDRGENSSPALEDLDRDGDGDLLIAANGIWYLDGYYGSISRYENLGDRLVFREDDYLNILAQRLVNIRLQFFDINGDLQRDPIWYGFSRSLRKIRAFYQLRGSDTPKEINVPFSPGDQAAVYDLNEDGNFDLIVGRNNGELQTYLNNGTSSDPVFSLNQTNFLGINSNFFRREPYPVIADLDKNGLDDLIVTDVTGEFRWFKDLEPTDEEVEILVELNNVTTNQDTLKTGTRSRPAFGYLSQNTLLEMVSGNASGGIYRFLQQDNDKSNNFTMLVYPNPAGIISNTFKVESNEVFDLEIIAITGQTLFRRTNIPANFVLEIDKRFFKPGIYIIRGMNVSGRVNISKLLISN